MHTGALIIMKTGDIRQNLLHWYDASLFYLYEADFLRNHNLRSVQTIAILGIVFNNVGDSDLHYSLWGAAIRIAQDRCFICTRQIFSVIIICGACRPLQSSELSSTMSEIPIYTILFGVLPYVSHKP